MSFPRDTYPYTNFHELNLGYFIVHFREIFSQWADLYDQMLDWKDETTEELAAWKTGVEADLDQRETALRAELEAWKTQTGQDIAGWEDATLAALTAWQTATQAVFEAIRVEAAGSATAAAASATDAATAKTAAETAQAAAEAAAASVQASAAQITTNTEDIADLKTQLTGETPVSALSHFTIGAMSFGGSTPHINPDFTNACASTDFMEFDVDTVLHVDPEYQTMRYYYNEETEKWVWTEPWSAGDKTVEANKIWGISIRKGEGGSETANIPLYTSKVTITNVIGEHTKEIEKLNEDIEDINDELDAFPNVENNTLSYDLAVSDENDYTLVEYKNGHIKTKNFDSEKLFSKTYKGAEMPFGKHYYSAEKYMDMNYTPQTYIEGGVCFGNYYFQFSENMTTVGVFDLSTKQHIYTWTNPSSGDHCNSANFGNEYYSDSDTFPLLYVSGQRTHKIYVYRVTESNGTYDFTLVQTITFGDSTATGIYYPDYSIDIANRHIIASGYVTNSYDASGNKTIISVYNLPGLNDGDTTIAESDKVKTFILPEAFTGSQGAFAIDGKVYEVFGFSNPRYIVVFDTLSERISSIVDITNDIAAEPEALFVYNKDLFVASQDLVITKFIF